MKNNKNNRNSGFTLIELMVVVSIMGVMIAIIVPSISPKYTTASRTTAVKIDDFLSKGRIRQMGRSETVEIQLYYTDTGIYGVYKQGGDAQKPELLGGPAVQFCDKNGNIGTQPTVGSPITVIFDRSTGALKSANLSDGTEIGTQSIFITSRTRVSEITIYKLTGRHKTLL